MNYNQNWIDRIIYHLIFIILHKESRWQNDVRIAEFRKFSSLSNPSNLYSHKCHSNLTATVSTIVPRPLMGKSTYFATRVPTGRPSFCQRIWIWLAAISNVYLLRPSNSSRSLSLHDCAAIKMMERTRKQREAALDVAKKSVRFLDWLRRGKLVYTVWSSDRGD